MIEQGHNPDPVTGACQDCGARREEIDDNLVPICEKITGPHRLAIIVLRREQRRLRWAAHVNRHNAAALTNEARECEHDERELAASADALKGETGEPRLSVGEAIHRDFDRFRLLANARE